MKIIDFALSGLALTFLTQPTLSAEAMRCNVQISSGQYAPVLRVVTQGAHRDIRMGSEGLTRKIFYRDQRVVKYLASVMGIPSTELPSSVSRVCGAVEDVAGRDFTTPAAPPAPVASPAPPEVGVTATEITGPGDR